MLTEKYQKQIKDIIFSHLPSSVKAFIFGSSLEKEKFADVDIGFFGQGLTKRQLSLIEEDLEKSNLPYKFDLIDFNQAEGEFKKKVFKEKILWIN